MFRLPALFCLLAATVTFAADEQLTINKVTISTPSGTINGKVVGTGDSLVFVDDSNPSNSFTLHRGEVQQYRTEDGAVVVEMVRPSTDRTGTTSNLRITVTDPANTTTLTKWLSVPVERARTVTTYSTDCKRHMNTTGAASAARA